jgi:hypothetical protein
MADIVRLPAENNRAHRRRMNAEAAEIFNAVVALYAKMEADPATRERVAKFAQAKRTEGAIKGVSLEDDDTILALEMKTYAKACGGGVVANVKAYPIMLAIQELYRRRGLERDYGD